ncbi:nuclear transport factor 2 family protein [Actinoplanes aureus]|uniref:nuclear transport factor 2 family protein n=1 Tax=Actinoplanes aureus TaxID=2792083 RepID=UPI001E6468D3|nr:nuclear transport factor 2 family protein [Actinoplanes aureus]
MKLDFTIVAHSRVDRPGGRGVDFHHVRHSPPRHRHRHRPARPSGDRGRPVRFGLGQDLADRALFASSFADRAELDFRPAAARWGATPPLMTGRDAIVDTILDGFAGRVVTTHQVTNPRVEITGDTAALTALVEAQHVLTADPGTFALLKNRYDVELVRDGARWVMTRVRIDNVWLTGDPVAIFGTPQPAR